MWKCKWNKPFPLQPDSGHGVSSSNANTKSIVMVVRRWKYCLTVVFTGWLLGHYRSLKCSTDLCKEKRENVGRYRYTFAIIRCSKKAWHGSMLYFELSVSNYKPNQASPPHTHTKWPPWIFSNLLRKPSNILTQRFICPLIFILLHRVMHVEMGL